MRIISGMALVLFAMTLPTAALAGGPQTTWGSLSGQYAGAVGICPPTDGAEPTGCYLVRCDRARGLVFVIDEPDFADAALKTAEFTIGAYHGTVPLTSVGKGAWQVDLATQPQLLTALKVDKGDAQILTDAYSTDIALAHAGKAIARVEKGCGR